MAEPREVVMKVAWSTDIPIGKILVSPVRPTSMRIVGGKAIDGLYVWVEMAYGRQIKRTNPFRVSTVDKLLPEEVKELAGEVEDAG